MTDDIKGGELSPPVEPEVTTEGEAPIEPGPDSTVERIECHACKLVGIEDVQSHPIERNADTFIVTDAVRKEMADGGWAYLVTTHMGWANPDIEGHGQFKEPIEIALCPDHRQETDLYQELVLTAIREQFPEESETANQTKARLAKKVI